MAYLLFSVNVFHKVLNTLKIIFKLNSKVHAVFFPSVANWSIKTQHTVMLKHLSNIIFVLFLNILRKF